MKRISRITYILVAIAAISALGFTQTCPAGQISVSGTCTSCKTLDSVTTGSSTTGGNCLCPATMSWIAADSLCECKVLSSYRNPSNLCVSCKNVSNADPTARATPNSCACLGGATWDSTALTCNCSTVTQVVVNGSCTECANIQLADVSSGTVNGSVCYCAANAIWNKTSAQCECNAKNNFVYNPTTLTCIACNSSPRMNGKAINSTACGCVTNAAWDSSATDCICSAPVYTQANNGSCACNFDNNYVQDKKGTTATKVLKCKLCSTIAHSVPTATAVDTCACDTGYLWNATSFDCSACNTDIGYVKNSKGNCVLCTDLTVNGTDILKAGQCSCPDNAVWNSTVLACVCNKNYAFSDTQTCICDASKKFITNTLLVCVQCNDLSVNGTTFNSTETCNCPTNAAFSGQVCTCNAGYIQTSKNTGRGKCVCDYTAGTIANILGACVQCNDPSINGLTLLSEDNCSCPAYSNWTVTKTVKECKCQAFRVFNGTDCQCDPLAQRVTNTAGKCVMCNDTTINGVSFLSAETCSCPIDTTWDPTYMFCNCSSFALYNSTLKTCVCDVSQGAVKNAAGICTPCTDPTINGLGVDSTTGGCKCPANAHWNKTTKVCECNTNYTLNASSQCQCDSTKQLITTLSGSCVPCTSKKVNGISFADVETCNCPSGLTWDPTTQSCICATGMTVNNSNPSNIFCQCPSPQVATPGGCVACTDATVNASGVTLSTYVKATKSCACAPNAIWVSADGSCSCKTTPNIYAGATFCIDCARDKYSTGVAVAGTGCTCKTNFVWNDTAGACQCDSASGNAFINGACTPCSAVTNSDSTATAAGCGCNAGFIWKSATSSCVCDKAQQYTLVNGVCTQCSDDGSTTKATVSTSGLGCSCYPGYAWSTTAGKCSCDYLQNYVLVSGTTCTICTDASIVRGASSGATRTGCACTLGAVWDPNTFTCICNAAQQYVTLTNTAQSCKKCPTTAIYTTGGTCTCRNVAQTWNSDTNICAL